MNCDQILNMKLPSQDKYIKKKEAKVAELEKEHSADDLDEIILWLSSVVLSHLADSNSNHYKKPDNILGKFEKSIHEIEDVFRNQDSIIDTSEPEAIFLCRLIGEKIAYLTKDSFAKWNDVFKLIIEQHAVYHIYDSWINNLPKEIIEKNKKQLHEIPPYSHPLELVRTWGYLGEKRYWESFDENNRNNKKRSRDAWEYVDLSIGNNNEFELANKLKFKSDLLKKLGSKEWLLWVISLPIIHIKGAAIAEINSIDDAEEMIKILLGLQDCGNEKVEEMLVLTIQYVMVLWKKINNDLEHYSSDRWVYSDEERLYSIECKKQLELWKNEEVTKRSKLLADTLLSNENSGKNLAIYMLRYLSVRDKKDFIIMKVREALINSFVNYKMPPEEIIEKIIQENINKKTILNSLLLLFRYEESEVKIKNDTFRKFWGYYYNLLNADFHWQGPLVENNDDGQLLWTLAGVLANLKEPDAELAKLLNRIYTPSEGWSYDAKKYYSSINKLIHCLTIGAMATEWIVSAKTDKTDKEEIAKKLFDFVWGYTHNWLRSITSHYPPTINELLVQLWARLPLIYGNETKEKIIEAVRMLDDLSHILICNKVVLLNNRRDNNEAQLDEAVKELLRERFDELFPIVRAYHTFDKAKAEWYLEQERSVLDSYMKTINNKKIWLLNHYAITPTTGGGTRHYDFAAELVGRGYDVTIFAAGFDHKLRAEKLSKGEKVRKETVNGVNFVWLKTFSYQKNDKRRIVNMFSFMFRVFLVGLKQKKPDVIVASSPHLLTCLAGYFLARIKKARYVVEIRDLWPQSAVDMGLISASGMTNKILKIVEKFIYKKAEKIIVLLPGAVSYIKALGIDENKVKYIPNGVDVKRYDQVLQKGEKSLAVEQIRQKHKNNFRVLYLGAHGQANVLDVIIDAAKIIQDQGHQEIDILFVGDGPEKEHLIAKADTYGLNNIFFYQPVKKVEVPLLLDHIDIATISMKKISLYKYGISPNKIFDYLCVGKPIVFAGTVLNNMVKEANAGISIPPEDPQAFAQAIIDLYHMTEQERNLLGANGRKYVEEYHDIPVLVDEFESVTQ